MNKIPLILANFVSGLLIIGSLSFLFIAVAPADVLKDWSLKTSKNTYVGGEVLTFTSTSTKLRKADGIAYRAIECDRPGDKTVAYSIDTIEIGRKPGYNSKPADIVVPTRVTNRPATCRLIITANYKLYLFRHTDEYAASNDFVIQ